MPDFVARGEKSLSKLNLIKTYLRSSVLEERFRSLAALSIVTPSLKTGIGENYAHVNANKVNFH
jgi:hypothetical protein